jgi:hypothetical protein
MWFNFVALHRYLNVSLVLNHLECSEGRRDVVFFAHCLNI